MEAEGNSPPVKGDEIPTHFVVELRKGVYIICERMTVLDQNSNLPVDLIESYLERYRLRAAPLPGGSGDGSGRHGLPPGLHEAFMAFQTGRAPLVNVTIHNDVTNDPKSG